MGGSLLNFLGLAIFLSMCLALPVSMWLSQRETRWIDLVAETRDREHRIRMAEHERHMEKRRREFHAWLDTP